LFDSKCGVSGSVSQPLGDIFFTEPNLNEVASLWIVQHDAPFSKVAIEATPAHCRTAHFSSCFTDGVGITGQPRSITWIIDCFIPTPGIFDSPLGVPRRGLAVILWCLVMHEDRELGCLRV